MSASSGLQKLQARLNVGIVVGISNSWLSARAIIVHVAARLAASAPNIIAHRHAII